MSLRTFDAVEHDALEARVRKTWSRLAQHDYPEVTLPALLQGFGDWRRVAAPVSDTFHRVTCVLFRSASTDEYALISLPYQNSGVSVDDRDMGVLLGAARQAVVGDYLQVWRWTLDANPPLGQVAMLFVKRLPVMSEEIRFLSAFTLVEDTFRAAAAPKRAVLEPMTSTAKAYADRLFWESTESDRSRVADWAVEEANRFIDTVTVRSLAEDKGALQMEVDQLVETFVDTQHEFDPTGQQRVPFAWSLTGPHPRVGHDHD